jgi:hypothetical protein
VLLRTAEDPGVRLRHIAVSPGITERSVHGIVTDPAAAGHVMQQEDGRGNANMSPAPEITGWGARPRDRDQCLGGVQPAYPGASAGRDASGVG